MKTKAAEKSPATPLAPAPRRRARKAARTGTVSWDEIAWALDDAEQDGQALLRLVRFLDEHGLRTQPSAIESAIQAISELQTELARLRAERQKRDQT